MEPDNILNKKYLLELHDEAFDFYAAEVIEGADERKALEGYIWENEERIQAMEVTRFFVSEILETGTPRKFRNGLYETHEE